MTSRVASSRLESAIDAAAPAALAAACAYAALKLAPFVFLPSIPMAVVFALFAFGAGYALMRSIEPPRRDFTMSLSNAEFVSEHGPGEYGLFRFGARVDGDGELIDADWAPVDGEEPFMLSPPSDTVAQPAPETVLEEELLELRDALVAGEPQPTHEAQASPSKVVTPGELRDRIDRQKAPPSSGPRDELKLAIAQLRQALAS